jgi:hypothetical protein
MANEKTIRIPAVVYEMLEEIAKKNKQKNVVNYLEQLAKEQYKKI